MNENLEWTVKSVKPLLKTRVFDVELRESESATGVTGDYVVINAPKWVNVIAAYENDFIMVRQYRHGYGKTTLEFPGGVQDDPNEPIEKTAYRELIEETGFQAGKIKNLGAYNPNPALFSNEVIFCLAEDLTPTNEQHLDSDEILNYVRIPINEVVENLGKGEFVHAFLGTAIMLYMREKGIRYLEK